MRISLASYMIQIVFEAYSYKALLEDYALL